MNSIRKRLVFSILLALAAGTLLLAIATHFSLREEMDELFDENMKQMAESIASQDRADFGQLTSGTPGRVRLRGEDEFLIQVWNGKKLEYSSLPSIDFPFHHRRGFGALEYRGDPWRYYVQRTDDRTVQVSQDTRNRYIVIREIQAVLLVPILLQFPVVAALVWWLIGYGFGPLLRVSRIIRSRTPAFLDPLPLEDVPEEIASLVSALNDLLAALRQAIEMQARFTADAAHELRTPLTAVKLQLDMLGRANSSGERDEAQQALQRGVERSMRLVGQLLELARQDPGAFVKEPPQAADLDLQAAAAIELLEPLARHREVALEFIPGGHGRIAAPAANVDVLIANLVNNALLYTPRGGRVCVRTVAVAGGKVVLEVCDSGKGIPAAERARIFDRFYRLPGTETVGSGLGLSIVRTIAERYGADISLYDGFDNASGGKGACFRVSFPAAA